MYTCQVSQGRMGVQGAGVGCSRMLSVKGRALCRWNRECVEVSVSLCKCVCPSRWSAHSLTLQLNKHLLNPEFTSLAIGTQSPWLPGAQIHRVTQMVTLTGKL